jgi:cyclopropane fatty-acyl-phospholipid synthase-like methyltransferase
MDERRRVVEAGYDAVAFEYAALEQPGHEWPRLRLLREALERVQLGSTILDLGCGNGIPGLLEIARSHEAIGVELSKRQANLAAANVPKARVIHGDALEVDFAPESFQAVVAAYLFDHLPRERHAELLAKIRRWLAPNGLLLFSVEPEEEPSNVREWLGEPMFFSHFDASTTLRLVEEAGFEILKAHREIQLEGSRDVEFLWVFAVRAATP